MTFAMEPAAIKTECSEAERALAAQCVERIEGDLRKALGCELELAGAEFSVVRRRPVIQSDTHLSFRFGVQIGAELRHGALLVPLEPAIVCACRLLMMTDEHVEECRSQRAVDGPIKDSMLEVAHFVASAIEQGLTAGREEPVRARTEGCQGIAAGKRVPLELPEGDGLIAFRARASLQGLEEFDVVCVLPKFD